MNARRNEHFFARMLRGILPMLVWILHFAFVYGLAAGQCTPAGLRPGGPDIRLLGIVTVAAILVCAWLAWRGRGVMFRHTDREGHLLDWIAFVGAVLALVAVAWNGVPLLLVDGCA